MTHQYAVLSFARLNAEGLANFAEDLFMGFDIDHDCQNVDLNIEKNGFWSNSYLAGSCFFNELYATYGAETFRNIFYNAHQLNGVNNYHLFQDIINPVVGDDALGKFGRKYQFSSDPKYSSPLNVQYFWDPWEYPLIGF
jgi:hypothetical protein